MSREKGPEDQLLDFVIDAARMFHWAKVTHFRGVPVRRKDGSYRYMTPLQGDPGFPDLVLVRERVVFAELKGRRHTKPSPEQREWREALLEAGAEYHLWYPEDRDRIVDVLR